MVSGNRNTVVKRTGMWSPIQMRVTDFTPLLVSTDGWGTSTDTSNCRNSGSIKEVLGGWFCPLSIRVWFKACWIEQKDSSKPSWAGLLKGLCYEWVSRGRWSEPAQGHTGCALGVPPSLTAHGDPHLANCLCSYCRRGNKEYLTKAKELGKEKKIWCLNLALYRTTLSSGWSPLQTLWAGLLLDSLSPCMEFVDLQQQIHLSYNANDTVELW